MNGVLLIDKPAGLTSAEVVRRIKRRLPTGTKVGHLGTLDPFATGILPLCLGEATKIAPFLNDSDKGYTGLIQLGTSTDTGDRTGQPTRHATVLPCAATVLEEVARRFTGALLQRPPMYSALKRAGVPLYRLARQGVEVERQARPVRVDALTLTAEAPGRLRFDVICSKGTYVRVLAEEIGAALGTAAHVWELRRTRFGAFTVADAATLDDAWQPSSRKGALSVRDALQHLPALPLDATAVQAVRHGKEWVLARLPASDATAAVLLDPAGEVAALIVRHGGNWRYARVLAAPVSGDC